MTRTASMSERDSEARTRPWRRCQHWRKEDLDAHTLN